MGLFTKPAPVQVHPDVLLGAAHELGHVACHRHHRIRVLRVTYDAASGTGCTTTDLPDDEDRFTAHQWRAWLISSWAGWEAEVMWSRRHGGSPLRGSCQTDLANFRNYWRRIGITEGAARSAARSILRGNWARIEHLAPKLAQQGRITW